MAADDLPNFKIQRRPGIHTGYAPIIKLQGLLVPGNKKGGCGSSQSKRCMLSCGPTYSPTDIL